jgi:hypothetical protein
MRILPTFDELNQFLSSSLDPKDVKYVGIPRDYKNYKQSVRNRKIRVVQKIQAINMFLSRPFTALDKIDPIVPVYLGGSPPSSPSNVRAIYLCIPRDINNKCAGEFDHITILENSWVLNNCCMHITIDFTCSTKSKAGYRCSEHFKCEISGNHRPVLSGQPEITPASSPTSDSSNDRPKGRCNKMLLHDTSLSNNLEDVKAVKAIIEKLKREFLALLMMWGKSPPSSPSSEKV